MGEVRMARGAGAAGLGLVLGLSLCTTPGRADGGATETPTQTAAAAVQYTGEGGCRRCHFAVSRSWLQTGMAKALELLKPGVRPESKTLVGLDPERDYTRDASCLPCHTTGYGEPGGFRSPEETPALAGVQCEACHGPGGGEGGYLKVMTLANRAHRLEEATSRGLVFPVPAQRCVEACHNERSPHNEKVSPKYAFDAEERMRTGGGHAHWRLKNDHGPLPESYFQTRHPELLQDG